MKKVILFLFFVAATCVTVQAQKTPPKAKVETSQGKTKVKPNTTVGDKAHNVIHPKHKTSHGIKMKHKPAEKAKE
jgi:hypothetical protein